MNIPSSPAGARIARAAPDRHGHPLRALARLVRLAALVVLFTLALAAGLFVPVAIGEFAAVDTVVRAGVSEPAGALAARLGTQFLGLLVLSFGLVAFILSVLLTPPAGTPVFRTARFRPRRRTPSGTGPDAATGAAIPLKGLPNVRPL